MSHLARTRNSSVCLSKKNFILFHGLDKKDEEDSIVGDLDNEHILDRYDLKEKLGEGG